MVSTSGSKILDGFVPPYDATVVARCDAAGLPMLGKLNMDEFAMGSSTENSGYKVTRNPWNLDCVPGGSSGGSAAIVAAGGAPWAWGTDTGGSVRQPASLCGLVGAKPTYGLISRYGMIAFASSLDQAGPLTRTVKDAAALIEIAAGSDPMDSTSIPQDAPDLLGGIENGVKDMRIGIVKEFQNVEGASPGVMLRYNEALTHLEKLGASLEEVSLPSFDYGIPAYYLIAPAECSANLARYDGVRYGLRVADDTDIVQMMSRTRDEGFGDEVKRRVMLGTYALSAGYYDAYYGKAQKVRTLIMQELERVYSPGRPDRLSDFADDRVPHRREGRRPPRDVPVRRLHRSGEPRRERRSEHPGRPVARRRVAGRFPVHREVARRGDDVPRRVRARAGARLGRVRSSEAIPMSTTEQDLYETTVGLEIHVELSTASKMFCGCEVAFGGEPNTRTCPVCLGMPGSLPVANEKAIENTMKIALALNCHIVERSVFHRKNYFYPDMPKNYQISQYDYPLGSQGFLEISGDFGTTRVGINRVHLEEDTGKSIHVGGSGRIADSEYSLEDFNRAGTPLVEIVSEPDIHSAEEARVFVSELRTLLESLGVSDVRMEEGSMRVDANVSDPAARRDRARCQGRSEEHELDPFRRSRSRVRGEEAARGPEERRAADPRDAPLRREDRHDILDAHQGVRVRLSLLRGARPGPVRTGGRVGRPG